jgi:hypothetical protein
LQNRISRRAGHPLELRGFFHIFGGTAHGAFFRAAPVKLQFLVRVPQRSPMLNALLRLQHGKKPSPLGKLFTLELGAAQRHIKFGFCKPNG